MGKKLVHIPLDDELLAALDDRARREGRSRAEIVREACRVYVQQERPEIPTKRQQGALALIGAWGDLLSDEEIDQFIADVYAEREKDTGRPVDLEP